MRDYLRVLGLMRQHRLQLIALVVCIVVASSLSTLGVTFVSPLLRMLFEDDPVATRHAVVLEAEATVEDAETSPELGSDPPPKLDEVDRGLLVPRWAKQLKNDTRDRIEGWLYAGSRMDVLWRLCVSLLIVYVLRNLFTFCQEALRVALEQRIVHQLREDLYGSIRSLPLGHFSSERTGYLMSRVIVDVDMMRGAIVGVFKDFLANSLMVMIALSLAALVSWKLLLTTLLVVPPNMILVTWISKKLRRGSHSVQEQMGTAASVLQEMISGIRIVKAFDVDGLENSRFDSVNAGYTREYVKLKVLSALSSPVSEILGILTAVVIIAVGGRFVIEGKLRPDLLVLFLTVILWVIAPIKTVIKANSQLQESLAAARRIFDVLDAPKEGDGIDSPRTEVPAPRQSLIFENVGFEYKEGVVVLDAIDLTVGAGEVVALVGPSGAGKSTLVDLVPRFHEPTTGRLLLDGVELREFELRALRRKIGVVSQEVILFHDTVLANIAFGSGNVKREAAIEAAKTANAHDFIQELPEGYDTVIGDRGLQLSGGQRQRLAIARAVLKNPPILILDEATSALDTESERAVQEAMERLMVGRTTLVIAHRLSTVTTANCIVVMQAGRIVERGTHPELLARGGAYRRLHDLQFQSGRPSDADDSGDPAQLAG